MLLLLHPVILFQSVSDSNQAINNNYNNHLALERVIYTRIPIPRTEEAFVFCFCLFVCLFLITKVESVSIKEKNVPRETCSYQEHK